ncbi:MAG: hypothetical protein GY810_21530 [Aureispira sp.]|nr:hypothetical protein [Aureispira sp.]
MNFFLKNLYKIDYRIQPNGQVLIRGYFVSVIPFVPIVTFFFGLWGIFSNYFWIGISVLLASLLFMYVSLWNSRFRIQIDANQVCIQTTYFCIPTKTIKESTSKLIVSFPYSVDFNCISARKDYYHKDIQDNLRLSYIEGWDDDQEHIYIDYEGKDIELFFWYKAEAELWDYILKAFEYLDTYQSTKKVSR